MAESTITDVKTARALVKFERDRSKVVYSQYIDANGVTLDTVGAHVKALQELAFPKFDAKTADDDAKYARKAFGNRIRNGLNHTLGKRTPSQAAGDASTAPEAPETAAEAEESAPEAPAQTPVGAFADAVRAFREAGYSAEEAAVVVADVYDVAAVVPSRLAA